MKKKAYIMIIILIGIGGFLYFMKGKIRNQASTNTETTTISFIPKPSSILIPTERFKLLFIESGAYIQDIHQEYNCKRTINGTYFGTHEDGTFFPAGIRLQSGIDLGYQNTSDPNLQEYLEIDEEQKSIIHITPEEVGREAHKLYINAGPLLIQDGEINPEIYQNISHWNKPYPRTILVIAEHKQPFLYVSLEKVTLPMAAIRISNMTEHGKMTAINLDGGPSTAIIDEEILQKGFFVENQLLPIFFYLQ